MKTEALKNFPHIELTLLALILFVMCFLGIIVWIFRSESKTIYRQAEQLPLDEGVRYE